MTDLSPMLSNLGPIAAPAGAAAQAADKQEAGQDRFATLLTTREEEEKPAAPAPKQVKERPAPAKSAETKPSANSTATKTRDKSEDDKPESDSDAASADATDAPQTVAAKPAPAAADTEPKKPTDAATLLAAISQLGHAIEQTLKGQSADGNPLKPEEIQNNLKDLTQKIDALSAQLQAILPQPGQPAMPSLGETPGTPSPLAGLQQAAPQLLEELKTVHDALATLSQPAPALPGQEAAIAAPVADPQTVLPPSLREQLARLNDTLTAKLDALPAQLPEMPKIQPVMAAAVPAPKLAATAPAKPQAKPAVTVEEAPKAQAEEAPEAAKPAATHTKEAKSAEHSAEKPVDSLSADAQHHQQQETSSASQQSEAAAGPMAPGVPQSAASTSGFVKLVAANAANADTQRILDQVRLHIQQHSANGATSISLQLHPQDLGRLDIQMKFTNDGKASLTVTADNPATLELLQKDSRQLQQALTEAGFPSEAGLNFSLGGGQHQQNGQQAAQQYSKGAQIGMENAEVLMPTQQLSLAVAEGVDIRI